LASPVSDDPDAVEQQSPQTPTPKDATKVTAEQRELQDQLEHQNDDPDAPARHQNRHDIADET
jgi:hypothetical protein